HPALQRRPAGGSSFPGVREPPPPGDRSPFAPRGHHQADRSRRGRAVHAPPRRVRARRHAGAGAARAGRRGSAGGEVFAGAPRAADPLHRRLHPPRLRGRHPPGAVERGDPSDRHLSGDEDRPDLLLSAVDPRRPPLRIARAGLEVPGTDRPDTEPGSSRFLLNPGGDRPTRTKTIHAFLSLSLSLPSELPSSSDPPGSVGTTGLGRTPGADLCVTTTCGVDPTRSQVMSRPRSANRVNSGRKVILTVPVDPERCLAMMISARPLFSWSSGW